ncbi:MAG: cytochrome P450 [Acidimicrobiia bacterium]|nr:cytochrome P450 [Acidimicrobiia bacterium]
MDPRLARIPGDEGLPILGQTHRLLGDAERWALEARDRFGPVYRTNVLFRRTIVFGTADAARTVLLDRERVCSSTLGWDPYIGRFFARGLMLRDFDEHRLHRGVMRAAFRQDALAADVEAMRPIIDRHVEALEPGDRLDLYAFFKRLTLDIAALVFVGARLGPEADRLNRAFVDAVAAGVAPIRAPLPFTAYRRGLKGRRLLETWFAERVAERRTSGATDLFTRLSRASDDDGARFSDRDVVDHMIFLLMAAHDTTTSTLASMAWYLSQDAAWQDRIRSEAAALEGRFGFDDRDDLEATEHAFREAMRLHPPVPFIPRRLVADTEIGGHPLPADTQIVVSSLLVHRDPDLWSDPHRFDPVRFGDDRAEHTAHSHAFVPFSGGAHTCIGMHFAGLMTKAILARLLHRYRLVAEPGQQVSIATMPIPKPRGGLPLRLQPA